MIEYFYFKNLWFEHYGQIGILNGDHRNDYINYLLFIVRMREKRYSDFAMNTD